MKHTKHATLWSTPSMSFCEARQACHFMNHAKHPIMWSTPSTWALKERENTKHVSMSSTQTRHLTDLLQRKTMTIINFQSKNCNPNLLFSKLKLLKFNGKVLLENMLLIRKFVKSFCHQSSKISLLFAPIFATLKQFHPLLVN